MNFIKRLKCFFTGHRRFMFYGAYCRPENHGAVVCLDCWMWLEPNKKELKHLKTIERINEITWRDLYVTNEENEARH